MNPCNKPKYISKAERAQRELERETTIVSVVGGET